MKFKSEIEVNLKINGKIYDNKLFESLKSINQTYSQRKSAKELGISHAVLNRRIKKAEEQLGTQLVKIVGSGSELSNDGYKLLEEYQKYYYQLEKEDAVVIAGGHIISSLLESMSDNVPWNILVYSSDDESAYKLAKKGVVDILALDDPLLAFEKNLDFIPIAYDYLTLVSSSEKNIMNIHDLTDLKFIKVKGTAQRLAWNTLKEYNIPFTIEKEVKSQFDAYKIVRNSNDLYTFLNASYFNGNDVLKNATNHAISLIPVNEEKKDVKEVIDYILNEGQEKIKNNKFTPIKTYLKIE
ncbi:LysR family transcriptional regulator [Methanobrevibacter sp. OttesenSCG-928-K11]|nr:LysR family transcriptional regulator [Methanobrevibacter sp. OttesenSCG-928-K11]MDL2270709.1 LysR family transcriptional regulator [Methanobrevibacter sp. OttesenSCG-928-I08]